MAKLSQNNAEIDSATDSTKIQPAALIGVASITLLGIWANLVGHGQAFASVPDNFELLEFVALSRPAFYVGLILCGVLMLLLDKRIPAIRVYLDSRIAIILCLGTVGDGLAWRQDVLDPLATAISCSLLTGFGFAWIIRSLYLQLAKRLSLREISIVISIGLASKALLSGLITLFIPLSVQVVIGMLLAPASCLLVMVLAGQLPVMEGEAPKLEKAEERIQITMLSLLLLGAYLVQAISGIGFWGNPQTLLASSLFGELLEIIATPLVFLGVAWLVVIRRSDVPLVRRYQLPLLVLVSGSMAWLIRYLLLPDISHPLYEVLVNALELTGELSLWVVVVASLQVLRFGEYRIMGATALAFGLLSEIWILVFRESVNLIVVLVLVVVFCVLVALVGFPLIPVHSTEAVTVPTSHPSSMQVITERYSLTPRESEILTYLIHGRSRPYIQEKLFLSDGTIKTHTTHIYAKLSVHTRQELLDLVESVDEELAE